jgi:hypothetical protein
MKMKRFSSKTTFTNALLSKSNFSALSLFFGVFGLAGLTGLATGQVALADSGTAIADFYSGVTGTAAWTGQASFSQMGDDGTLPIAFDSPTQAYLHLLGPNHWSMGALICQANSCYYVGDETEWANGALSVLRADGHTVPAQVVEATPYVLAYSYVDPYGDLPTTTEVRQEIVGDQFIRHTLIRVAGYIYEDYLISVARPPARTQ